MYNPTINYDDKRGFVCLCKAGGNPMKPHGGIFAEHDYERDWLPVLKCCCCGKEMDAELPLYIAERTQAFCLLLEMAACEILILVRFAGGHIKGDRIRC